MLLASATDLAIQMASRNGTLRIERCHNARLDMPYWAISDDSGLIEVAMSADEAERRVNGLPPDPAPALAM